MNTSEIVPYKTFLVLPEKTPFNPDRAYMSTPFPREFDAIQDAEFAAIQLAVEIGLPVHVFQRVSTVTLKPELVGYGNYGQELHEGVLSDFERNARPVDGSNLKTKVNAPNLETMTQTFDAWIEAPGLPEYRYTGDVRALRKAKKNPEKYQHFVKAWLWSTGNFRHLIAQNEMGEHHIASHTADGQRIHDGLTKTFIVILR